MASSGVGDSVPLSYGIASASKKARNYKLR